MKKYNVSGMSCAACSARVEKAARSVSGVRDCAVNLLTGTMTADGDYSVEALCAAVEKAGYGCSLADGASEGAEIKKQNSENPHENEARSLLGRLLSSVAFLLVLMYFSMGHNMLSLPLPSFFEGNYVAIGLVQLLCAAAVMVINGKFFKSGFSSILRLSPNMDALVSLGSGASFLYSTVVLFLMCKSVSEGSVDAAMSYLHGLYFESAAMILALITVGKALEARSKSKTGDALRGLANLAPERATVIRNGSEVTVDISEIAVGDIFTVRPGEQIPVDGFIVEGKTAINEAAITGESIPAEKAEGDTVVTATLNTSGYIKCKATRVGNDTVLAKIIQTVSDAAATKAPIAKMADKVAAVFVPCVMAIALITAIAWLILGETAGFALARAVSVLVISCPCSLGLATPVAIMVGSGVGAKNGILFKSAEMLEAAGRVKTVVLDKTGTVTDGNISVCEVITIGNAEESELLAAALAVEKPSEHPLARAVVEYCEKRGLSAQSVENFKASVGSGVSAVLDGKVVIGGKAEYLKSEGVEIPELAENAARELSERGITPLYFASDGRLLGIIGGADTIKSDSCEAIERMHGMGLRVVMLSGDNELVTKSVAKKAGIDQAISGATPDVKSKTITALKSGGKVAMVGDGINDAPALASADVGIAIGTGTDIARDTAGIILMGGSLLEAENAIRLSRSVLVNIKQNLFWAFLYNCIGIPIAAGVLSFAGITLSPMIGALAMGLSSFCVVSNALRLNLFKAHKSERTDTEKAVAVVNYKEIKEKTEEKKMEKKFNVKGMMCQHCEAHVKKALEAIEGVAEATASHKDGTVTVKLTAEVDDKVIIDAIVAEGYEAQL